MLEHAAAPGAAVRLALLAALACGESRTAVARPPARPALVLATVTIRDVSKLARALAVDDHEEDVRALLAELAGVPGSSSASIEGRGRAHVLLLDRDGPSTAWVLAANGSGGGADGTARDPRVVRRLGPALLLAPDEASARALGPWVERALLRRTLVHDLEVSVSSDAAPRLSRRLLPAIDALADELREQARSMRIQMGRAPEIGEPEAVADWAREVGRRLVQQLGEGSVDASVDLGTRVLTARVSTLPRRGTSLAKALDEQDPGTSRMLAQLPGEVLAAIVLRRSAVERRAASRRSVELLGRLAGPRLQPGEDDALRSALERWDAASGPEGAAALLWSDAGPALLVAGEAARPEDAATAAREVLARLGQGHLGVLVDRLGLDPSRSELAVRTDSIVLAIGRDPAAILSRASGSAATLSTRREIVELLANQRDGLLCLGAVAPTALFERVAPVAGDRWARIGREARQRGGRDLAVWATRRRGTRWDLELRIPTLELRALAGALIPGAPERP